MARRAGPQARGLVSLTVMVPREHKRALEAEARTEARDRGVPSTASSILRRIIAAHVVGRSVSLPIHHRTPPLTIMTEETTDHGEASPTHHEAQDD